MRRRKDGLENQHYRNLWGNANHIWSDLIDIDVRQIDTADIRRIWYNATRELVVFGTIRENIQMGFNEYEDDRLLRICKIAGVDFVEYPKDTISKL